MNPKTLVSRLPVLPEDADPYLRAVVVALGDILKSIDDFQPLYARQGNLLVGNRQIETDATRGFLYMPRFQGTPTGTPNDYNAGSPYGFDEANDIFYVYDFGTGEWVPIGSVDDSTENELWLRILLKLENIEASL